MVTVTAWRLARHHPARVIWAAGGRLPNHPAGVMCRASQTAIFGHVTERHDVTIVGSGAGGGTLAHTLTPSGTAKRTRSTTCTSSTRVFFPSIGAMNPALIAMANAICVGDHLLSRMA
jgi:hypothetical protein